MRNIPTYHIDPIDFRRDPYPDLANLRANVPLAFVPELGAALITRHVDVVRCEKNIDVFSSHQPEGLMNQLMGHNLMRKDGKAHMNERMSMMPAMVASKVKQRWHDLFSEQCQRQLDAITGKSAIDLVSDFAMPVSGTALVSVTGLHGVTATELDAWSQAMIDGIANYHGDSETEERCKHATQSIDKAIDDAIPYARAHPQDSLLSLMLASKMAMTSVKANIKLVISGGQNEPRDAIAGVVWAVLTHPNVSGSVRAGNQDWHQVLAEYLRWQSAIGMSPRRIAKEFELHGGVLETDDRVFLMFGSANRDQTVFPDPDTFDITRDNRASVAFGAGPHFCLGAAVAKMLIADVALPALFERFPDITITDNIKVSPTGWAFRGLDTLPVNLSR